jgi:hypothetical protein
VPFGNHRSTNTAKLASLAEPPRKIPRAEKPRILDRFAGLGA